MNKAYDDDKDDDDDHNVYDDNKGITIATSLFFKTKDLKVETNINDFAIKISIKIMTVLDMFNISHSFVSRCVFIYVFNTGLDSILMLPFVKSS